MSSIEGLAVFLREMSLVELGTALVAILAYALAINGSYSGAVRSGAGSTAFAAAVGFTTLTPSWMSAIVFLALAVVGVAAFAGLAWALSSLLGLTGTTASAVAATTPEDVATSPVMPALSRGFAPHTSAQPL